MNLRAAALAILLGGVSAPALAQAVLQAGPTTGGHAPGYVANGFGQPYVRDSGSAALQQPGGGLSEINITSRSANGVNAPPYANSGNGPDFTHGCMYDADSSSPSGQHFLCFDPNAVGGGLIEYGALNGAPALPLQIKINGTLYQIPFPSGSLTTGAAAANLGWVSVTAPPYNADPTGTLDSTTAFINATNSGALAVYFPPGNYKACGVQLPVTAFLHMFGAGDSTKIIQGNCGKPVFFWPSVSMNFSQQTVSDLMIDATGGNAHSIDTTGKATLTFRNVGFINTPAGFDNIYVNGTAATYTHTVRIIDSQDYQYSNGLAGNAVVEFGPLAADSSIDLMYAGGGLFNNAHMLVMDAGSVDIQVNNSHVYNTTGCVVLNSGSGNTFNGDVIDFSSGSDIFCNLNAGHTTISNGYLEAIAPGHSGISNVNSVVTNITNEKFISEAGAVSAVKDDASSVSTVVDVADIGVLTNFSNVFDLRGLNSIATHVPGYAPLGILPAYSGSTTADQAQNTTVYIGQNGAAANYLDTAFVLSQDQVLTNVSVYVNVTPASGQSFVFTLFDNSTPLGSCNITNTQFGCVITPTDTFLTAGDSLYLRSAFSATSGSAKVRFTISGRG